MVKCDGCKKMRPVKDTLVCSCCDGRFCLVDPYAGHNGGGADSCIDRHEESGA